MDEELYRKILTKYFYDRFTNPNGFHKNKIDCLMNHYKATGESPLSEIEVGIHMINQIDAEIDTLSEKANENTKDRQQY